MTTTEMLERVAELLAEMGEDSRVELLAAVEMYGDARADEALSEFAA